MVVGMVAYLYGTATFKYSMVFAWRFREGMVASMLANLNSTVTFKYSMLCYTEGGGGVWGN